MSDVEETALVALDGFMEAKRAFCESGQNDPRPIAAVILEDGESHVVMLEPNEAAHPVAASYDLIWGTYIQFPATAPVLYTFSADTYLNLEEVVLEDGETLGGRFAGGDDSISEGLISISVDLFSGETAVAGVTYRYDHRGEPVFGEPILGAIDSPVREGLENIARSRWN